MYRALFGRVALALIALSLVSCASYFKRKECEKTNWFEYGQGVALQGRRLTGDAFVNDCRKVEAEINEAALDTGFKKGMSDYCKPETAYANGRKGEFFSSDMCVGEQLRLLQTKHKEGVTAYCQPGNSVAAGAEGRPYNSICPKDLEAAFLPGFNKGRKKFLTASIHQKEQQIDDIDREIEGLNRKRSDLALQMNGLPNGSVVTRERSFDATTNTWRERQVVTEDEATKRRREELERDIRSSDSAIHTKREQQRKIRTEIRQLQTEISGL